MSGAEQYDETTIQQLEERLNRGWELIEQAEQRDEGDQRVRYTDHWLTLLAEYEDVCDSARADDKCSTDVE